MLHRDAVLLASHVPESRREHAGSERTVTMRNQIKLAEPRITPGEEQAALEALRSGRLAQGPRVAAFEEAFARQVGATHAVAVNSGTAALHLALIAQGIGTGDEVIVPAFTFAATANTVLHAGARPVFCDVRDDDFGIDAAALPALITTRTRAIIAVHLYGQMCDIAAVRAAVGAGGIAVVEDAAQAVGARMGEASAGSAGTAAVFSFYATKNLQTGEGGMLTTNDAAIAARARLWRSQGEPERYVTEEPGYNYRMTEIAAALGSVQLSMLVERNAARARNAARLSALLAGARGLALPQELSGRTHVWHQYTVRVTGGAAARDALRDRLAAASIETGVFYPTPLHRQPLYRRLGYEASLPTAERLAQEVLSLPVHPFLSEDDLERIGAAVLG